MKIKTKITFGFGSILLICGIALNLSIHSILNDKMETTIKESLNQLMGSTSESIKYRVLLNSPEDMESRLLNESSYLVKYISLNNSCTLQVRNNNNDIISDNTDNQFPIELNSLSEKSKNGSAEVYMKYSNDTVTGMLSYPIYAGGEKLGVLNLCKEYKDLFTENNNTIDLITIIEALTFMGIFSIAYFITSKIINPVIQLTDGVKNIEEGNYNFDITVKGNDEVSILSKEFLKMKEKIQKQITTINEEKEKVELLEKHRKEFFDNVTHELKTPLTAITGYAEMLKDNIVSDAEFKSRAIKRIYLESERITNMVLNLINVSKGNSQINESFSSTNIKDLITDIAKDMQIKADKYNLIISEDLLDYTLVLQKNRIEQVFINLIDNAIKYSNGCAFIDIKSYIADSYYIVEITNCATPIPDDVYNNIFNPFVKSNLQSKENSSGLGLYISKEIIDDHNGNILITNGNIITVKVFLPI